MWNFTVGMQLVTCNVSQELCNKVMELLIKTPVLLCWLIQAVPMQWSHLFT